MMVFYEAVYERGTNITGQGAQVGDFHAAYRAECMGNRFGNAFLGIGERAVEVEE